MFQLGFIDNKLYCTAKKRGMGKWFSCHAEIMDSVCRNRNLYINHKNQCEFSHIMVQSVLWHLKLGILTKTLVKRCG